MQVHDHRIVVEQDDGVLWWLEASRDVFGFPKVQCHLMVGTAQSREGDAAPGARDGPVDVAEEQVLDAMRVALQCCQQPFVVDQSDSIRDRDAKVECRMMHEQEHR